MSEAVHILIFEPGIMQFPFDARNWDGRAATWCNKRGVLNDRADYFCGPIGRRIHQQRRIERAKGLLQEYLCEKYDVSIVGHSNGTDIMLQALAQLNWPKINALHLVSGACDADFERNGLNYALLNGRIKRVVVYIAGKDRALRIADTLLGRLLGYGSLGRKGPLNIQEPNPNNQRSSWPANISIIKKPEYGHSTWWEPAHFDETMGYFV